eukprot:2420508-Rhodomonas_salina.1
MHSGPVYPEYTALHASTKGDRPVGNLLVCRGSPRTGSSTSSPDQGPAYGYPNPGTTSSTPGS